MFLFAALGSLIHFLLELMIYIVGDFGKLTFQDFYLLCCWLYSSDDWLDVIKYILYMYIFVL